MHVPDVAVRDVPTHTNAGQSAAHGATGLPQAVNGSSDSGKRPLSAAWHSGILAI